MRRIAFLVLGVVFLSGCPKFLRRASEPIIPVGRWVVDPDTGCTIVRSYTGDTLGFIVHATLEAGLNNPVRYPRWFRFPKDSLFYRGPETLPLPSKDLLVINDPARVPQRWPYRLLMRNRCRIIEQRE